jgi:hypothetical protein
MPALSEIFNAIRASRSFTPFFSGVDFHLVQGQPRISIKVAACQLVNRSPGFRFSKYSVQTNIRTANGIDVFGYGESDVRLLAVQKSIAEGVERAVFKISKSIFPDMKNSNGWAAHVTNEKARRSARSEIMERDSSLVHWLSQTPMRVLPEQELPRKVRLWQRTELMRAKRFNVLSVLVSSLGSAPIAATFVHDSDGYGFVSQATDSDLNSAIERALAETCRIADHFAKGHMSHLSADVPKTAEDHAIYYALKEPLPKWLFGSAISWREAESVWESKLSLLGSGFQFSYDDFSCGSIHVSRCQSSHLQSLYFGPTEMAASQGGINFDRIEAMCGSKQLCMLPHFVP